ncbi:MAG TPA: hypothetical protein VFR48_06865, partial [Solirubrobacteraceae bacterium]|nr:hypothetical protein [Solirubrobacteraceae bacterium]
MTAPRLHTAEQVSSALASIDVLAVVRDAFLQRSAGSTLLAPQTSLHWRAPDSAPARSIAMHAYLGAGDPCVGLKLINAAPANVKRGLPRADGLIALFDPLSARIVDLLPAGEISAARTAAVSVLAAQELAVRPAPTLALLGAGTIAAKHLEMLATAGLGIELVRSFDLDPSRTAGLARISSAFALKHRLATSARAAVVDADIVVTATTTTEPYLRFSWLKPGALAINVSLDDLHDEVFTKANAVYVDDLDAIVEDGHRRLGRLCREGAIATEGPARRGHPVIRASLGDLFAGLAPGRV